MKPLRDGVLTVLMVALLCSCVTVSSSERAGSGTPGPSGEKVSQEGEPFYVAADGLKLYPEPKFSKNVIVQLPLNEKVVRIDLHRGFAQIRVLSTGQTGWVDNARLSPRRVTKTPGSPPSGSADTAPAESGKGPAEAAPASKGSPVLKAIQPDEAEAATVPPEKKPDTTSPRKREGASIFDPF